MSDFPQLSLPSSARRPVLGCGAGLGGTFCLLEGVVAQVFSQGATPHALRWELARRLGETGIEPEVVACDPHPAYASRQVAGEQPAEARFEVQHHHAHFAAVLAEHGAVDEPAVGAIYDSGGFGLDGTVWGGEILAGLGDHEAAPGLGPVRSERCGLLFPVRMPGGEVMAHERWRAACAWIAASTDADSPEIPPTLASAVGRDRWQAVADMARTGVSSPLTTSVGRMLGAVDSLTGALGSGEGAARPELDGSETDGYEMPLIEEGAAPLILDARPAFRAALGDVAAGVAPATIRARFTLGLAEATAAAIGSVAERAGAGVAVLTGDAFAPGPLRDRTAEALAEAGIRVLTPEALPSGDAAISFGQAAVAAWADHDPARS